MISQRRLDAKNHAVYLQRRVDDFPDQSRPTPKWTERDYAAVAAVLREFRDLEECYDLAVERLQDHGLPVPLPADDGINEPMPRWRVEADLRPASRRWWQFWKS